MFASWHLKRSLTLVIAFSFLFTTITRDLLWAAQAARSGSTLHAVQLADSHTRPAYAQAKEQLDRIFQELEEARAGIDRSAVDPAARAASLGPSIEDLYRFVRDEIAYQPYVGTLRFAQGTLVSRAGNSCDQSLLLAEMLGVQGHRFRYARAHLPGERTGDLVRRARAGAAANPPQAPDDLAVESRLLAELGIDAGEIGRLELDARRRSRGLMESLSRAFEFDYRAVGEGLAGAGITAKPETADLAELVAGDRGRYCWLQVERNGAWLDLDPAAGGAIGQAPANPEALGESLPAELAPRVRLRVHIAQSKDGQVGNQAVLDHTAVLDGTVNRLSLGIIPDIIDAQGEVDTSGAAGLADRDSARSFDSMWPMVRINGKTKIGQPFDMAGTILPEDPQARAAAAVASANEGALGGAGNALNSLFGQPAKPPPPPELARVWVQIQLSGPDGKTMETERHLAERNTALPKAEAENDLRRQLLAGFDALATGALIKRAQVRERLLDEMLSGRNLYSALLAEAYDQPLADREALLNRPQSYPLPVLQYLFVRSRVLQYNAATHFPGLLAYPDLPQVVAFRQGAAAGSDGTTEVAVGFDVLFNQVRAVESGQANVAPGRAWDFQLQQGIVDTLVEYLLLGGGEALNAHSVLARAAGTEVPLVTVSTAQALAGLPVGDRERAAMAKDLSRGYVLVAPAKPVNLAGKAAFAWWRVDPTSGRTLGMAGAGEGAAWLQVAQTTVQYTTLQKIGLGLTIAVFCLGVAGFTAPAGQGASTFGTCVAATVVTIVAFMAGGYIITHLLRVIVQRMGITVIGAPQAGFWGGLAATFGLGAGTVASVRGSRPNAMRRPPVEAPGVPETARPRLSEAAESSGARPAEARPPSETSSSTTSSTEVSQAATEAAYRDLQSRHNLTNEAIEILRENGIPPEQVDQMAARGIPADETATYASEYGRQGIEIYDHLTARNLPAGHRFEILDWARENNLTNEVHTLATARRQNPEQYLLRTREQLHRLLEDVNRGDAGKAEELREAARIVGEGHRVELGQRGDVVDLDARVAYQMKLITSTSPQALEPHLLKASRQLSGVHGENPQALRRAIYIRIANENSPFHNQTTAQLREYLSTEGMTHIDVDVVQEVQIVNGNGRHTFEIPLQGE